MEIYRYLLFMGLLLIVSSSCKGVDKTVDTTPYTNPVLLADPFIMLFQGVYYAYGTHSKDGIEVYTSDDLNEWKKVPNK